MHDISNSDSVVRNSDVVPDDDNASDIEHAIDDYASQFDSNATSNAVSNSTRTILPRAAKQHINNKYGDMVNYDLSLPVMFSSGSRMSQPQMRSLHPPRDADLSSYYACIAHDPLYLVYINELGAAFIHSRTGTLY